MSSGERTSRIITKLKKVCKERGLSPSDVYDMVTSEFGCQQVSMSSISRIFDEGSESAGFRYTTIKPVVKVLLGVVEDSEFDGDNDEFDASRAREYFTERNALQEVVRLKSAEEDRLRSRIEALETSSKDELARLSLLHDQNIARLLDLHQQQDKCQSHTISILEQNNNFLQQMLEAVRQSLCDERESKKRMYEDVKKYIEQLHELATKVAVLEEKHKKAT